MAKKLTPNQLKVLRDLAERYHNNDLQSRVLPVDKRTARGMTTLERPFIKLSFPIAKTDYYLITETGLNYLAALDAQPAIGTAQAAGYTYPELLDKYFPGEPEEPKQPSVNEAKPSTPVSPVLNNALNVLTGENRQWVEVKPEQRIAEVFSLLDDAGVRDGGLMSITDRVKALIQERDRYEDALVRIRTWHRSEKGYSQEMVLLADEVLNPTDEPVKE